MASSSRQIVPFQRLSPWWPFSLPEDGDWFTPVGDNLDVYETDNEVVVEAAVPGIPANQVNVTFEDGVLRIKADYEETEGDKTKKKAVYRQQRTVHFDYTTTLPRSVDATKISAEVDNGVVTVKAPITEESKPKRISVKAKKGK